MNSVPDPAAGVIIACVPVYDAITSVPEASMKFLDEPLKPPALFHWTDPERPLGEPAPTAGVMVATPVESMTTDEKLANCRPTTVPETAEPE